MPTVPVKAAGWRIEPPVSVAVAPKQSLRGDRRSRTAGRSARHQRRFGPGAPPRRNHRPEIRCLVRRAHRELIEVELAEHHGAIAPEIGADRRFIGRREPFENVARRRRLHALRAIEILDAERVSLRAAPPRISRSARRRPPPSPSAFSGVSTMKALRIRALFDLGDLRLREFDGGDLPFQKRVARFGEGKVGEFGQCRSVLPCVADVDGR